MDLWETILEAEDLYVLEADKKVDVDESPPSPDHIDDAAAEEVDDSKKTSTEKEADSSETDDQAGETDDQEDETTDTDGADDDESSGDGDGSADVDSDDANSNENEDESSDESNMEDGESNSDEQNASEPSQDISKNSKVNTIILLDNFISLYKMIDSTIKKISESRKDNILASVTFNQVRANLSRLAGVVYKYITLYYDGNDHTLNLYNFKYFMEILKLNLEMIRKVVSSTNKETETSI